MARILVESPLYERTVPIESLPFPSGFGDACYFLKQLTAKTFVIGFVIGVQPGQLVFGFCAKLIDPGVFLACQIFTDLLDLGAGFFFKCGIEFPGLFFCFFRESLFLSRSVLHDGIGCGFDFRKLI